MQRPLLVLLIVLAAVFALVFAVLNLGGGSTTDPVVQPPVINSSGTESTRPTEVLTNAGTSTTKEPIKVEPRVTALGGPANIQFDNRITGLVRNAQGNPVAQAEVTLSKLWADDMQFFNDVKDRSNDPRVRTDAEGRYSFLGIEPRSAYSLIVMHPEYAMKTERTTSVGESGLLEQPPITLVGGAALSGYVKDDAGNMIPDAVLHLEGEDYSGMPEAAPDRISATTDQTGYYSFSNVAPGRRTVLVTAAGYGTHRATNFTFEKQERQERDITLKIAEMISGRVIGPGSEGIPKAVVIAVGFSSTMQTAREQVLTDDKGEFLFETLSPGEYNVIASATGWSRKMTNVANRIRTGTSNVIIEMQKQGGVCGTVIDGATGQPVPSFSVRMRLWLAEGSPTQPVTEGHTDVTSADGAYCLDGLQPSNYVVEARAPGYAPSFSSNFSVGMSETIQNVVIKLGRGGSITGRVVDGEGKPVARARVVTHENDWTDDALTMAIGWEHPNDATSVEVRTDESGKFTCTGLTPDVYQIVVTANGYTQSTRRDLRVTESGDTPAGDVRLNRGGTVRGTLYDAAGRPVSGGTISLNVADGDVPANYNTRTGEDGKFSFLSVMPGRYTLSGMRANNGANPFDALGDSNSSQVKIIVAEADTTTQDLSLKQ